MNEKAIQKVVDLYEEIENELLIKIAENFKINDEFLNSDYWRIKKLEEMGLFNKEVIEFISKYTNKSQAEIKQALNDIGYNTLNINNLNKAFENGKLKIDPNILIQNKTIESLINNAYNETTMRFIDMSSKIEKATRNAYLDIVEKTYLKTSMGTHSYQEAIKEAINELSNSGIKTLVYKTTDKDGNIVGLRTYDIEGTARREILTGARSLSNSINQEVIEELQPEYLYLSEHLRCRPTHFDWQGTIIKSEDLVKVTGYGEVDGLGGINCAHYFEAYFGSARGDDLKSISKEDALKNYELSQQQRYLERGIRKWKRKAEMYKANGDVDSYNKCKHKINEWQKRNQDFTKENKFKRDFTREYVNVSENKGFDKKYQKYINDMNIGSIDLSNYDIELATNDVVFTEERKNHILDHHPEMKEYINKTSELLNTYDKLYKEIGKDDTIWFIKKIEDKNLKITMKLQTSKNNEIGYKNSIIQMQFMREKELQRNINKGKIKEMIAKSDKK